MPRPSKGAVDVCRHAGTVTERRIREIAPTAMGASTGTPQWMCVTCLRYDSGTETGWEKRMELHGRKSNHPISYVRERGVLYCTLCGIDVNAETAPPRAREQIAASLVAAKEAIARVESGASVALIKAIEEPSIDGCLRLHPSATSENSIDELNPEWLAMRTANDTRVPPPGLVNLGNTCFMNATLQALASLESLKVAKGDGPLGEALYDLLSTLRAAVVGRRSVVNPRHFFEALRKRYDFFDAYEQQDAHDFLRLVFNALDDEHDAAKKAGGEDYGTHTSVFGGEIRQRTECLQCSNVTIVKEASMDLSLALRKPAIEQKGEKPGNVNGEDTSDDIDAIAQRLRSARVSDERYELNSLISAFCEPQRLEGEDAYACEKCHKLAAGADAGPGTVSGPAICRWTPSRLPRCLIVHIQRFSAMRRAFRRSGRGFAGFGYGKDASAVDLPLRLDFGDDAPWAAGQTYVLRAVVVHEGYSPSSGHYVALVSRAAGDAAAWYYASDSSVHGVAAHRQQSLTAMAYMAFYERDDSSCN